MAPSLIRTLTHPVETTLDALTGKWKPFVVDRLEERLLYYRKFRQMLERFRGRVRRDGLSSLDLTDRSGAEMYASKNAGSQDARRSAAGGPVMHLYVVRHGIAVEGGEAIPDASRPLTDKGRRRFQKTARAFAKLGYKLDLILTSPLVRAVQTAEILAGAADHGEVAVLEELDPKFDVDSVRAAIQSRARKAGAVAIVGHEPQLSSLLAALSGVPQADIDLRKGSIVRVDAFTVTDGTPADPRWWLKPKGARAKGLPLQKQVRKARTGAEVRSPKAKRAAKSERQGKRKRQRKRTFSQPANAPEPGTTAEGGATAGATT